MVHDFVQSKEKKITQLHKKVSYSSQPGSKINSDKSFVGTVCML